MSRDTINRVVRTVFLQGGLAEAGISMLRAFGVPITGPQQVATLAFLAALGGVVLVVNTVEDISGKSVLK